MADKWPVIQSLVQDMSCQPVYWLWQAAPNAVRLLLTQGTQSADASLCKLEFPFTFEQHLKRDRSTNLEEKMALGSKTDKENIRHTTCWVSHNHISALSRVCVVGKYIEYSTILETAKGSKANHNNPALISIKADDLDSFSKFPRQRMLGLVYPAAAMDNSPG